LFFFKACTTVNTYTTDLQVSYYWNINPGAFLVERHIECLMTQSFSLGDKYEHGV